MVDLVQYLPKIFEAGREHTYCTPEEGKNYIENEKGFRKVFFNIIGLISKDS